MDYPKPLMSITELNKMGYPRDYLERYVRSRFAEKSVIRTSKRGKYLIDVTRLEKDKKFFH